MPVLSLFYGIVIRMYKEISGKHHKPHIHVEYAEDEAAVALDGEILEGQIPKIMNVEALEGYKIKINYETGEIRMFDVLPYITGSWYKELYDYAYFKTIHVISNGRGIEWEHGQDIAPHELYEMSVPAIENTIERG